MSYSDNRIMYSEVHMLDVNSESTGKLYVTLLNQEITRKIHVYLFFPTTYGQRFKI
jgi:hypothetical protein